MVPQAFQLSSSGQTKFIPAGTCVEEAPLSTKRITRGGEEMAAVGDLSLMLLGKHVWRHFPGLTVGEAVLGSVQQQPGQCERTG